ncbi:MAG: UPF0164 family protein [Termitinemataceae bacterium]|nr:MAG: UPF0164 family protein [Termitinemataceae bacterium]
MNHYTFGRCRSALNFFSLFLCALRLGALDFDSDSYGNITDYLNSIYGIDENAGLTAFPILNIPIGGRAAGMAGAFSAVCDDSSFIEWNPAGSSTIENAEIAFFHNNWIADSKIEAAAFTGRKKNLGFGASTKWLYMPFTQYDYFGERLSKGYYAEGVAALNASYNFFPGYYFNGISLGINIKGAFRIVPNYAENSGENAGIVKSDSGASQSAAVLLGDIGLLTRFNFLKLYNARDKNMAVALVLRNVGMEAIDDPLPTVAVAAISYRPVRPLLVSFDYTLPINLQSIDLSEKPYFSTGLSLTVASFLSMRAGVLIRAGSIRGAIGSAVSLGNLSVDINYTLDLLTQLQPFNRVDVGLRINLGDGGRLSSRKLVDQYYLAGLEAYSHGQDDEAREWFYKALKINPYFDPATEGIRAIDNYESLVKRIKDLQSVEYQRGSNVL